MAASDGLTDAEMGFAPPAGVQAPAADGLSDADMGYGEATPEVGAGEALLRGAGQGLTLQHRDEIAGFLQAALDKLKGSDQTWGEAYTQHRDEARAADAAAEASHPYLYKGAEIAGGVAPMLIPGMAGGGIAAQAGKMALQGAVAGAGAANELGDVPAEAAKGFVAGGVAGGAGALAGRAVGAVAKRLAPGIQETADNATLRAAGNMGKELDDLSAVQRAGRAEYLRESGFVKPLDTVGHVSEKLNAAKHAMDDAYGSALGKIDEAAAESGGTVSDGFRLAKALQSVVNEAAGDPLNSPAATSYLKGVIKRLSSADEPLTMRALDELKRELQAQVNYMGNAMRPGQNRVLGDAAAAVKEHMFSQGTAHDAAQVAMGREALKHSADITPLAEIASARAGALAGHSPIGIKGSMGLGAGMMMLAHGNLAGLAVIAAGFASKSLEQRGNALAGAALNKLAKVAANPAAAQALGKWGGYVAAAAQRGPQALAAAHYTASQMDSQYAASARAIMNQPTPTDSGEDEVLSGAPPLDTSTPVHEP